MKKNQVSNHPLPFFMSFVLFVVRNPLPFSVRHVVQRCH